MRAVAHDRGGLRRRIAAISAVSLLVLAGAACNSSDPSSEGGDDAGKGDGSGSKAIRAGAGARGVTDDTIRVGLVNFSAKAGAAAAGAAGGQGGVPRALDIDAGNRAVIDHINSTGGIAGRQVEPVYYHYEVGSVGTAQGRQTQQQAACSRWTEDSDVFAFSGDNLIEQSVIDCARNSKTPVIAIRNQAYVSAAELSKMAEYWYAPTGFDSDDREDAVARFLIGHNFFTPDAKVAVMIQDTPAIRDGVKNALLPVLAEAGIRPALQITYPDVLSSPWPNYVLQLKNAGITHVVWSASQSPAGLTYMMAGAENQNYRPKWGVGSDTSPYSQITFGGNPKPQMANLVGVGWLPAYDIGKPSTSATSTQCADLMRAAGQPEDSGRQQCEFLFFLRAALARAPEVSPAGLAAGVAALRDSYVSVDAVDGVTQFGKGRHSGVATARLVTYNTSCSCLEYTSAPKPVAR